VEPVLSNRYCVSRDWQDQHMSRHPFLGKLASRCSYGGKLASRCPFGGKDYSREQRSGSVQPAVRVLYIFSCL
jgi:hypothetical protein